MKTQLLVLLLILVRFNPANAITRPMFKPDNSQVLTLIQEEWGSQSDDDPHKLFQNMNVTPDELIGGSGLGKVIRLEDRSFVMTCMQRDGARRTHMCQINLKASDFTKISANAQIAEMYLKGDLADKFRESFVLDANKEFIFQSEDKALLIEARLDSFHLLIKTPTN